ncbi:MAG: hypothetical protein KDB07_13825, partial [Planctomycetes bacterium]|nr:hypothetical protein [Planctomycetota bacterium]
DFPFIGYADTTKDEESYAEVRNHAELQALLEEGQTPERLALIGKGVNRALLSQCVEAFPKLPSLRVSSTSLENEDLDELLGFSEMRNLALYGTRDPLVFQQWLLDLFPDEMNARITEKALKRKAWCQNLVEFDTNSEFLHEEGSDQDPVRRLGAKFFHHYFKNVQRLGVSVRTLQRFLLDKASENVGGLVDMVPNLRHLRIYGPNILDADLESLATSIRRRSFLIGDESGLAARWKLDSFWIDFTLAFKSEEDREDKIQSERAIGFIRDGKLFDPHILKSLEIHRSLNYRHVFNTLYPAQFQALEQLALTGASVLDSALQHWSEALEASALPSRLQVLSVRNTQVFGEPLLRLAGKLPALRILDLENSRCPD